MFTWFQFTPESITALAEVILAMLIATYLFSLKDKSFILRLLCVSLVAESIHHFIKLIAFSVPGIYQSATSLLGVTSAIIHIIFVIIAYHYRAQIFVKESRFVTILLSGLGAAISGYLIYIFASAKPHNELVAIGFFQYVTLFFLILTGLWAIVVFLRKSRHFTRLLQSGDDQSWYIARRACYAFIGIVSLKILVILASLLSATDVISVNARVYASLVLHIFYLSSLTVVIIDYIRHNTSLQLKLIGLALSAVLLLLSFGGLSIYSTKSLLDQSQQFVQGGELIRFNRQDDKYRISTLQVDISTSDTEKISFNDQQNIEIALDWEFPFGESVRHKAYINKNGLISFGEAYVLADPPQFYLEQRSAPFKSTIHWEAFYGPAFIAPLHARFDNLMEPTLFIERRDDAITIIWENAYLNPDLDFEHKPNPLTFGVRLWEDGDIDLIHKTIDSPFFEGLIGIYAGKGSGVTPFRTASLPLEIPTNTAGTVYDLGKEFRSFVHTEVMPLVWLIVGSALFVLLIFPTALRASIIRPLGLLLAGVQRVDNGNLTKHVPVLTQDEIGNVASGFNHMMDSLKEANQELRRHAGQLEEEVVLRTREIVQQKEVLEEQAAKLREIDEMKSRFFANISHEFRTPLNLIMGPLHSMLENEHDNDPEKLQRRYHVMLKESQRLLRLINQVLDLSKMESGQMELDPKPHDLVSLWRHISHSFLSRAEMEQKVLRFGSELEELVALVDKERIEQIGYNLIDNALKFTHAGGKISVRIELNDENQAVISVQDTGIGIAKSQQPFIFDRFHRAENETAQKVQGTGIGLALVQELVLSHHGTITLDSEPEIGSRFTIHLPVNPNLKGEASVVSASQRVEFSTQFPGVATGIPFSEKGAVEDEKPLVLIVDDDEEFRAFIREYLESSYAIAEAENGQSGLEIAMNSQPKLIVSDLLMPIMDGVTFCDSVKQNPDLDHIPFILLTARVSIEHRIKGLEHGADDYLGKPVNPKELKTRIQNLLLQRAKLIEKYTDMLRLGTSDVMIESVDAMMLRRISDEIENHLSDTTFSVTLLADNLGLSVRDLQRKLKKWLDIGPKEMITNMRIEKAKELLAGRAGTVSQIAYMVGYSQPDYFMRIFKHHTGFTAGQFMKQSQS